MMEATAQNPSGKLVDAGQLRRIAGCTQQAIRSLPQGRNTRLAATPILILLASVLFPTNLTGQDSPTAAEHEAASAVLDLGSIDYLHYWVIPRSQRDLAIDSAYLPTDHSAVFENAQAEAARQHSDRMRALLETNENLYDTGMAPTGSPFFYTVFGLVQTGSFDRDLWIFQIASAILFSTGVCLMGRAAGLKLWVCLAILIALFFLFRPLRVDFSVANSNRLQVFLFALFGWLVCRERPALFLGGLLLGFTVAFKLTFALVPVFALTCLVLERRTRNLLALATGLALGVTVAVLIGASYFGSMTSWMLWQDYLAEIAKHPYPIELANYSLFRLLDIESTALSLTIAGVCWLVLVATAVVRNKSNCQNGNQGIPAREQSGSNRDLAAWGAAGLLVFLLSSPLVWSHYFLLAVPTILLLASYCFQQQESTLKARAVVTLLVAGAFLVAAVMQMWFRVTNPYALAILMQLGVLCLFVGTVLVLGSPRKHMQQLAPPPGLSAELMPRCS